MKLTTSTKNQLLAMCVCSVLLQGTCSAATPNTDLPEYDLGEVISTATKTKLAEKKVPMSSEVITAEQIKLSGATNVREVLKKAISVDVQEVGMTGNQVSVRGMSTNHTLILVDGQRMAGENTSVTMNVYELNRINLANIERIEIIRGAGSSLYGSDAMGGVINIITKKATEPSTAVGVFTGSKEAGSYFNYSSGQQGKVAFKINGNLTKERLRRNNNTSNMYGPKRYLDLGFNYDLDANRGLELKADFFEERLATDTLDATGAKRAIEWYDNNRSAYSANYYGHFERNDYNIRASYSTLHKDSRAVAGGSYSDWDKQSYNVFTVEGKNSYHMNDKNVLTYGAEFNKYNYESTRMGAGGDNVQSLTRYNITKASSEKPLNTYAFYLQDEYQINDKLFIVPSVRYDHHSSFGGEVSPKLGATYNLNKGLRLKANYGLGYRAPTAFELYSRMDRIMGFMRVQVFGNPDLRPEKSTSFDFALEGELGKGSGKIGYFNSKVRDLITTGNRDFSPGDDGMVVKTKYENISKAQLSGVEGQYNYAFDKHWSAKATYTYLDAMDESKGYRLDCRARHNGTVQLTYTDAQENPFTATLWNQWYQDYLYSDRSFTYQTINFIAHKQFNKQISAYVGVDNIFNKTFSQDATTTYAIDGRMWKAGMEWKL